MLKSNELFLNDLHKLTKRVAIELQKFASEWETKFYKDKPEKFDILSFSISINPIIASKNYTEDNSTSILIEKGGIKEPLACTPTRCWD